MGSQRVKDEMPGEGKAKKGKPKKAKEEKKGMPAEQKIEKGQPKEDIRYIVRIAGKDLNGELPVANALLAIKGISHRMARNIAIVFETETEKSADTKIGKLGEEFDKKLEEIVLNPGKHGLPSWTFNRKRDVEEGKDSHVIMADLEFAKRKDIQRLNEMKSYRGLRLSWGLPVRGQRTKSTHRGKGGTVGVLKKEAKQGK